MKKLKNIYMLLLLVLFMSTGSFAQDPAFSQFFSSPLNINPALTCNFPHKWRVVSNIRSQWFGPVFPYKTGTVSIENKIFNDVVGNYVDEITRFGIGGMMMYDETLGGALKSTYASFNVTGNIRLASMPGTELNGARIRHLSKIKMDEGAEQRLGVGLGITYGHKRFDITKVDFGEQFTGSGFDTDLPSGETMISPMKPYLTASAGIIYSNIRPKTNIDIGAAAFHINRPKQSFLNDPDHRLAPRFVGHANLETVLPGNKLVLMTNGIYQYQSGASYYSVGGAVGYNIETQFSDILVNLGMWYWSKNALIPYFGLAYDEFEIGLSYDFTTSDLADAPQRPHTFEISFVYRGKGKKSGVIPAPWK